MWPQYFVTLLVEDPALSALLGLREEMRLSPLLTPLHLTLIPTFSLEAGMNGGLAGLKASLHSVASEASNFEVRLNEALILRPDEYRSRLDVMVWVCPARDEPNLQGLQRCAMATLPLYQPVGKHLAFVPHVNLVKADPDSHDGHNAYHLMAALRNITSCPLSWWARSLALLEKASQKERWQVTEQFPFSGA